MAPRSPVVFWLLVAATISVDAVVLAWIWPASRSYSVYAVVVFHALVLSQLSIVCCWSALHSTKPVWVQVAPLPAAIVAAVLTAVVLIDRPAPLHESVPDHLAYFGLHTTLLIAALWFVQRTAFWRRRTAVSVSWHYSLFQLLIVMTIVAVLAAALRRSAVFNDDWLNLAFIVSSVVLASGCVVVWVLSWHWVLRLAAALGLAVVLGFAFFLCSVLVSDRMGARFVSQIIGSHYLIQAVILSLWLSWGPILPIASAAAAEEAASP